MSYFSEKIRKLRIEAGLTQKVIADEIGISQGNYSALENGKFDPSLKTLIELAEYYDILVDELLMSTRFVVKPLTEEAEFIGKKYDMLTVHDQIEIKALIDIKMRWYNERRMQGTDDESATDEAVNEESRGRSKDMRESENS